MIEIHNLTCDYGRKPVLNGFSMELGTGSFTALVGPNGAGKSTLLRCLIGYLPFRKGQIDILGRPLGEHSRTDLARTIAYIPQRMTFQFDYTVSEIVLMGRFPWLKGLDDYSRRDRQIAAYYIDSMELNDLADRPWNQLSGGEMQRVAIARALTQESPVLLLDESLANLDLNHQIEIMNLLRNLSGDKTILLVSHQINLVAEYCSRIVLMKDGINMREGAPEAIVTPENILQLFGIHLPVLINPLSRKPIVSYHLSQE